MTADEKLDLILARMEKFESRMEKLGLLVERAYKHIAENGIAIKDLRTEFINYRAESSRRLDRIEAGYDRIVIKLDDIDKHLREIYADQFGLLNRTAAIEREMERRRQAD